MRINRCESVGNINLSSEHIPGRNFDYRQLIMKGLCDAIGEFHANKTMGVPNFLFNPYHFGPI